MNKNIRFFEKLKLYRLSNNVYVVLVLLAITVLSVCLYFIPSLRANDISSNIILAVFTSLLASIVSISAETFVQYKAAERDEFLRDIHAFGISNLNKNKKDAISVLLKTCKEELWISGYRLIMTATLSPEIAQAIKAKAIKTRILVCPPWEEAYRLIYENEDVTDNYFHVIHDAWDAVRQSKKNSPENLEVRFIDKPFFSDTYRIDDCLVSGPYMHNRDTNNNKMTAKDFFSYNLSDSPLYRLVDEEFEVLWKDAKSTLDLLRFDEAYEQFSHQSLSMQEKMQLLQNICITRL